VPDRQAVEMVKYHLGWKLALHLRLGDPGFHPTTLVHFRQRLLEHAKSDLAFEAVLEALHQAGLLAKRCRQRLDSTHVVAAVANLSGLECVREALRLALEELAEALPEPARPAFWPLLWDRYVDSKLDYRSSADALQDKFRQSRGRRVRPAALAGGPQERPAVRHPSRTARRGAGPALCPKRQRP
jgi:hypothetical protein